MALNVTLMSTSNASINDLIATKAPNAGDWLIAIVAVRVTDGSTPALYVGDVSRNIWQLLYSGTTTAMASHPDAQMYVQVWACPAVRTDGWVDILRVTGATMSILAADTGSACWNVFTVTGFVNGHLTVDSVTPAAATAVNSFSVSSPSPASAANCLHVGVVCVDDDTATVTTTGSGFSALGQASMTTPGVRLSGQWKAATTGQTASWTCSAAVNWAGLIVAIRETGVGPAAPSANWPIPKLEIGLGYDMSTPLSAVSWTDQTTRLIDTEGAVVLSAPRGIPYELGEAQSELAALTIRNDDGAYTPRAVNTAAAANANGTTTTIKIADSAASNIHKADFFRIQGGVVDLYGRTVSGGIGTADSGQVYSTNGGSASDYAVGSGYASVTIATTGVARAFTVPAPGVDADLYIDVATDALATGASLFGGPVARWNTNTDWYMARLEFTTNAQIILSIRKRVANVETLLISAVTSLTHVAGTFYRIRFNATGPTLRAKAWAASGTEPDDWQLTATDGNLVAANNIGTRSFSSTGNTNTNPQIRYDNLRITSSLKELTVFQVTDVSSSGGTTTVTFARADGVAGGAQAATVAGDTYLGIPVDLYMPWRYSMYWAGKWWPVASGWFGQLPQTWTNAWWGKVNAGGIDGLATLTAANPSALAGEILRRQPIAYWPLSDSSGAGQAQDASGNNAPALVQVSSKYGTGANGSADFGVSTQQIDNGLTGASSKTTFVGDSGTGWAQTGFTAAEMNTNQGFALLGQGLDIDITDGITIIGFVMMNAADLALIGGSGTTYDQTLMIVRNTDPAAGVGQGAVLKVSVGHTVGVDDRDPKVTVWDKDTHTFTTTVCGGGNLVSADFNMWAVSFDRTSWTFNNNGTTTTGAADLVDTIHLIDVAGEADRFFTGRMMNALHCHIAIFPRALSATEIARLAQAGIQGTPDPGVEFVSSRVIRKLNTVGWRGPRVVHESDLVTAAEGDDTGTVAELVQRLSDYEDGLMFLDALGQLQWRGHVPGYYQQSKATLGERTDLGEIPYQPGGTYAYDTTYVYNDVQVTNQQSNAVTGASTSLTAASDAASASRYGTRSLPRSVRLNKTADIYGLAWSLLARYKAPEMRVGEVIVDCASYPAAWEFCLGVEVGDLVTVNKRPLNAPMISQLCRVLRVSPDIGPDTARWTLALGVADDPVIVLGAGSRAIIGNGTIGW
jgi:hypothetical protein